MSLSIAIITKNEELNLQACLESVKWADEIVLVDIVGMEEQVVGFGEGVIGLLRFAGDDGAGGAEAMGEGSLGGARFAFGGDGAVGFGTVLAGGLGFGAVLGFAHVSHFLA